MTWIAHLDLLRSFHELFNKLLVDPLLNEDARTTEADLALVSKTRSHAVTRELIIVLRFMRSGRISLPGRYRLAKISIIKNDIWILATKLQGELLVMRRRIDDDLVCRLRSASERYEWHVLVLYKSSSGGRS